MKVNKIIKKAVAMLLVIVMVGMQGSTLASVEASDVSVDASDTEEPTSTVTTPCVESVSYVWYDTNSNVYEVDNATATSYELTATLNVRVEALGTSVINEGELEIVIPYGLNEKDESSGTYVYLSGTSSSDLTYSYGSDAIYITNKNDVTGTVDYNIEVKYKVYTGWYVDEEVYTSQPVVVTLTTDDSSQVYDSNELKLSLNTSASFGSTQLAINNTAIFYTWQDDWGESPDDADDYFYVCYAVKTPSVVASKPNTYQLYSMDNSNGEYIGTMTYSSSSASVTFSSDTYDNDGAGYNTVVYRETDYSSSISDYSASTKYYLYRYSNDLYSSLADEGSDTIDITFYASIDEIETTSATAYSDEQSASTEVTFYKQTVKVQIAYSGVDTLTHSVVSTGSIPNIDLWIYGSDDSYSTSFYTTTKASLYSLVVEETALSDETVTSEYNADSYDLILTSEEISLYKDEVTYDLDYKDYEITKVTGTISVANEVWNGIYGKYEEKSYSLDLDEVTLTVEVLTRDGNDWENLDASNISLSETGDFTITFPENIVKYRIIITSSYSKIEVITSTRISLVKTEDIVTELSDATKAILLIKSSAEVVKNGTYLNSASYYKSGTITQTSYRATLSGENNSYYSYLNWYTLPSSYDDDINGFIAKFKIYTSQYGYYSGDLDYIASTLAEITEGTYYYLLPENAIFYSEYLSVDGSVSDVLEIESYELVENWKETSRTMLIVKVKKIDDADYNYTLTSGTTYTTGIQLNVVFGLTDESILENNNQFYMYMMYVSDTLEFSSGYDIDDLNFIIDSSTGTHPYTSDELQTLFGDLYNGELTNNVFASEKLYTGTSISDETGIYTRVGGEDDEDYDYSYDVEEDGTYVYEILFRNYGTLSCDSLILYDSLEYETGNSTEWRGTLSDIDVSELIEYGINPVIYYSTEENLVVSDPANSLDSATQGVWIEMDDDTDLSSVTAIAIDARCDLNGDSVTITSKELNVFVTMIAKDVDGEDEVVVNNASYGICNLDSTVKTYLTNTVEVTVTPSDSDDDVDDDEDIVEPTIEVAVAEYASTELVANMDYGTSITIDENDSYVYKISYDGSETEEIADVVIFDSLENITDDTEWRGTFVSIDTSDLSTELGLTPAIYYSTTKNLDVSTLTYEDLKTDTWTTEKPEDDKITAIAVYASYSSNSDAEVDMDNLAFDIYITLKADCDDYTGTAEEITVKNTAWISATLADEPLNKEGTDVSVTVELDEVVLDPTLTIEVAAGTGTACVYDDDSCSISEGDSYTYKITYSDETTASCTDLIFYNNIEEATDAGTSWRGTFVSVDVSELTALGITPTVYYSTEPDLDLSESDNLDLSVSSIWTKDKPEDDKITAIAVDASSKDIELVNATVSIYIEMEADCNGVAYSSDGLTVSNEAVGSYKFNGNTKSLNTGTVTVEVELNKLIANTTVSMSVASSDGKYGSECSISENDTYIYKITFEETTEVGVTDLIFYDNIEKATDAGTSWRGTFVSVDVSELTALGITPTVYYSTRSDLDLTTETNRDLSDENIWTDVEPEDPSTVTAIAVDASSDTIKLVNATMNIYIEMEANCEDVTYSEAGLTVKNDAVISYTYEDIAEGTTEAKYTDKATVNVALTEEVVEEIESTLSVAVAANGSGVYGESCTINEDDTYTYKITYEEITEVGCENLIFYDSIEAATGTTDTWRGTFDSVDTSDLSELGIEPVVYYSTVKDLDLSVSTNLDLTNENIWSTIEPKDLETVTAIAVDASNAKDANTEITIYEASIYVTMKADCSNITDESITEVEVANTASYRYKYAGDEYTSFATNTVKVIVGLEEDLSTGTTPEVVEPELTVEVAGTDDVYGSDCEIEEGDDYTYKVTYLGEESESVTGLIFYDSIEELTEGTDWRGSFESVDITELEDLDIDPVVYYSTVKDLDLSEEENRDLSDKDIWSTTIPEDPSTVTAIAVDASYGVDENLVTIQENVSIYIHMKADCEDVVYTADGIEVKNTAICLFEFELELESEVYVLEANEVDVKVSLQEEVASNTETEEETTEEEPTEEEPTDDPLIEDDAEEDAEVEDDAELEVDAEDTTTESDDSIKTGDDSLGRLWLLLMVGSVSVCVYLHTKKELFIEE